MNTATASSSTVLSATAGFVETDRANQRGLLQRAQAGDAEAFCELCQAQEARLFRQALSLCGENALAEELAQETLIEAWRCLRRYHGGCQFFTWLCAILLNRYRNVRRQKRAVPFSALGASEHANIFHVIEGLTDSASQPDQAAQQTERDVRLRQHIERLPHKHREIIRLRFFVDESLEGIAAALNCSVGTVKSRLFHALEKLRALHAQDESKS